MSSVNKYKKINSYSLYESESRLIMKIPIFELLVMLHINWRMCLYYLIQ